MQRQLKSNKVLIEQQRYSACVLTFIYTYMYITLIILVTDQEITIQKNRKIKHRLIKKYFGYQQKGPNP